MASNINPLNINGAFPIAGQDNDSQGFRDNFTNIKTNLVHSKSEIEDLQQKAILKSSLIGGDPINNSFAGVLLTGAQTKAFTETVIDQGSKAGGVTLDFTSGDIQKITVNGPISLEFVNWPSSGVYATMRVWFVPSASSTSPLPAITLPDAVQYGTNSLLGVSALNVLTPTRRGEYLIEFGTIDGGASVTAVVLYSPESATEYVVNTVDNNLNGHVLTNFAQKAETLTFTSPAALVDMSLSEMHKITTTQNLVLSFTNWPAVGYAVSRLWINVTQPTHTVAFPPAVSVGLLKVPGVVGQVLTPQVGNYLFELSTMDGGTTILIVPLITP